MSHTDYDVIVVGSGAAGGMAAYDLTAAGLKVLMLEAGRDYDQVVETPMFNTPEMAPLRGEATSDKPVGFYDATVGGGYNVPGEPFTLANGSDQFRWWRPRMLGGRTNHWGRVSLRYGPYDFKPKSRDGIGFDWPITYDDLAPWYDKVERLIGVTGRSHGIENTPDSPEGIMLPPPPPRLHEVFFASAFESMGMRVAAMRAAILTKPLNDRPACMFATPCTRGCSIGANFQSPRVLISPARATGKLTLRTNAVVHRINIAKSGRTNGVIFIDRLTGKEYRVLGKAVVLAAAAGASARILFNSKCAQFPDGVGNSSGFLGRFLTDTVEFALGSRLPVLEKFAPQNDDGMYSPHIYVPWWLYREQASGKLDFPRGYHIEPRGGRRIPTMNVGNYLNFSSPVYGSELHLEVQRRFGTYVTLTGEGEMVPNADTYCELDTSQVDMWGIPVLKFHWKWGIYEHKQVDHMYATFNEVFRRLGGDTVTTPPVMPAGGSANHMVGGCRMGVSRSDSVVNEFGQCWDVPNLFVLDGSVFVTSADKNPTLTILALASRGSHQLASLARKGSL